jgi:hypothetical protein
MRGSPGIGKSAIMKQATDELGIQLIDMRLSQYDPTDLKGFPDPDRKLKRTNWLPLGTLPYDKDSEGIVFLDELTSASPSVQAVAYQLVFDFAIGEYKLPPKWSVMAAGNRETDRAVVHRMSTALISRFVIVDIETNVEAFAKYAVPYGIKPMVLAYLNFQQTSLNTFDPATPAQSYACPRTWMFANDTIIDTELSANIKRELLVGTIGEGTTTSFLNFCQLANDLPEMSSILKTPKTAKLPANISAKFAVTTSLALSANLKTFPAMMQYMERLDKEMQCLFIRDSTRRSPELAETKEFTAWLIANESLIIRSE